MRKLEILAKYSGVVSFILLIVLMATMAIATFIEKNLGSQYVYENIYYSFPFKFLWLLTTGLGTIHIVCRSLYKQKAVFALHMSFIMILFGAAITHLTSLNGYVHIREGEPQQMLMLPEKQTMMRLPFTLSLRQFEVAYYKGTAQPRDYISHVIVNDTEKDKQEEHIISMNNILNYKGYRFYQSSFDEDHKGSVLSVNRDVYGIPVTYAGYLLLVIASIWVLITPNGRFRNVLRHPLLKGSFVLLLANLAIGEANARPPMEDNCTINPQQAERIGNLWMHYNGRICPVETFASDFVMKMTEKKSYHDKSASQFLVGFMLFPERWNNEPIIKVNDSQLANILGVKRYASYNDCFDLNGNYKLDEYVNQPDRSKENGSFSKAIDEVHERVQLIFMLQRGNLLEIFPISEENGHVRWFAPSDQLPEKMEERQLALIQNALPMYHLCITKGEIELANKFLERIEEYQANFGGDTLPSELHKKAELIYTQLSPFKLLFMINLAVGLLIFGYFVYSIVRKEGISQKGVIGVRSILLLLFLLQTAAMLLRSYISGRLPLSNGYETMLLVAWCALLLPLFIRRQGVLLSTFGILLAGFTLLVAHISSMNPQITPLVPVLSSPLLSIHVAIIMMAYAMAGFMALNSLLSMIFLLFSNREDAETYKTYINRLRLMSEIFLFPCALLLGIGIFIGAVWANVSWGRYWGWDPKEVWALIAFLFFGFTFHRTTLPIFRNSFFFHAYALLSFASILMTYFGVNYFLGGKHSYAGKGDMGNTFIVIGVVLLLFIGLVTVAYWKWRQLNSVDKSSKEIDE